MQKCLVTLFCCVGILWVTSTFGMNALVDPKKDALALALRQAAYNDISKICQADPSLANERLFLPDYGGETAPLLYVLWKYAAATKSYDRDAYNKCVDCLLDYGAKANASDHERETPLHKARNLDHVKKLCEKGVDVNAQNEDGVTPLIRYIQDKNSPLVDYLVNQNVNIFVKDVQGSNALLHAVAQRNIPIIDILFSKVMNYSVNMFDNANHSAETPIGLALKSGTAVLQAVSAHIATYLQNALVENRSGDVKCLVTRYPQFDYASVRQWAQQYCQSESVADQQAFIMFEKILQERSKK